MISFKKRNLKIYNLIICVSLFIGLIIYGNSSFKTINNSIPRSQYLNYGDQYPANYTINNMVVDGILTIGNTEWNSDYMDLSDIFYDGAIYFQWNYTYLFVGFWIQDSTYDVGDFFVLYLDVDDDNILTNYRDCAIVILPNDDIAFGVWEDTNYITSDIPEGLIANSDYNFDLSRHEYEIRLPMENLSNPYSGEIGFSYRAYDDSTTGELTDPNLLNIDQWNQIVFNWVTPTLGVNVDKNGGYNDSTRFKFNATYQSTINRPPLNVILNITSRSNPQLSQEFVMLADNPSDNNMTDGKSYFYSLCFENFTEGEYEYFIKTNDGKQITESTKKTDIFVVQNTDSLILFDGMHYSYRYTGIFGTTALFNDTYSYDSGTFWNIDSTDTYLGTSTSLRVMDSTNRGFDVISGTYHFNDLTHEYAFIPIHTNIGDSYFISVIGEGDVNFTCVQKKVEISALGGQIFYAFRLTNGSSELYYDMQTGLLLYGNFIVTGMGTLNDYELTLQTNNIYTNLWKPLIKNIEITPKESDINSTVLFNVTYSDWDGNSNEIVNITFMNGSEIYGPFTMSYNPSLGSNRKTGVSYLYTFVFWNTSFLETWKNYTTLVTAIDGRHSSLKSEIGPNITYINSKQPTLSNWDYTPSSPIGNETSVEFSVTYIDLDNNYPQFLTLNLPSGSYLMTQVDLNDHNFTDGAVYSYMVDNIPYIGTHNYNFTIIDQEGGILNEIDGGTIDIYDQPPDIYINSPITWQIGEHVLIDLSSNSLDVDTIFYNVTNLATMTNQTFIYSGPSIEIFPAGSYELFAWINDSSSNYNMTSKLFATTQEPSFKIMLVDMDNSTLETYYINALESIGFKSGQHYEVWNYFPTISDLSGFNIMILLTGASEFDFSVNDSVLCEFVENGGSVLIAGQEYLREGLTVFAEEYLGIYDAVPTTGTSMNGIVGNLISGNGYPNVLQYTLSNIVAENYTQQRVWSLYFTIEPLFEIGENTIAIMNSSGNGRIAFLAFEFARITGANNRTELMKRLVYWLANSSSVTLESPNQQYYHTTNVPLTLSSTDVSLDSIWYSLYDVTNDAWLNVDESVTLGEIIMNLEDETDYRIFIYTNNCWGYFSQPIIYEFRCDNTPPTFLILNPTNTTYIDFRVNTLNFTWYSSSEDLDYISINVWNYSSDSYVYIWDSETFGLPSGTHFLSNYGEGYYRFEAYAIDYAMNPTELFNVNFTINYMPNVTIVLPNVARISNNSIVQINITATDKDGVHTILYDIMNVSDSQYIYQNVIYDNSNPATWYLILPDGTYRIFGKANDTLGIMSLPIRNFTFTIDTIGPTINTYMDIASAGENWIGRNNMYILFNSPDSYLSRMWYRIYNSTGETWLTPNNVSYTGTIVNIPNLVEAEYVVMIWANDSLNNVMQIYRYVKIDLSAPTFVSIDLDTNEINTPIEVTLVGDDFTSVSSCTMYYQISGVSGTTQITMTKSDTWTFQTTLPGWDYGANITYWFTLRDSLQHSNTSQNYTLLINGLASGGDYLFDYRTLYNCEVIFNITSGGNLYINVSRTNPIGVSIPNIRAILSYIDIEFDGIVESAEIRIYYSFGIDFSEIKLMHYSNGKWVKIDLIESEDGSYAYATLSSFSTYALVQIEQTFFDMLMNPIILSIILALLIATIIAFTLYSRTNKKYKEGMGGVQSRKLGKLEKQDMSKYEAPATSTDFPEKNVYDSIKEKKEKAKIEMKMDKTKKQVPPSSIKMPTSESEKIGETAEEAKISKPYIPVPQPKIAMPMDIKEIDYYCENCKKTVRLGFLAEQPSQPCPDCGTKMGIKVVCKKCGASFQVNADQYDVLIKQKTPCPKCKTPLV